MKTIFRLKFLLPLILSALLIGNLSSAAEVVIDQDDALVEVSLDIASTICPSETLESFMQSTEGLFKLTIKSKTFPTGLKSVTLNFESSKAQLVVIKAFVPDTLQIPIKSQCKFSSKQASGLN